MVLAIPTKNRTAAFSRCLGSLRDNAEKYNRDIEFLVVDDSDDGSNRGNQQVLDALGVPFRYYDRKAVSDYAVHLSSRAECPLSLTQFLFKKTPAAHGAVRNFLTLMSANNPFIMIDDDMVCKFAHTPHSDEIEYVLAPNVVYPTPSIIPPVDETQLVDDDFIGKHEMLLDKVPLTVGGSVGDSGVTHSYMFFRSPTLLEQVVLSPETMLPALHTRQLLRSTTRPKIVKWSCCVGMSFGLDPAHPFPPFLPVGRSEDVLFGGMLQNCYGGLSGYCNYSMWHSPRRPDTEEGILTLGNTTPPEFFYGLLVEVNPKDLEMFGETLIALSHQDLTWVEENRRKRIVKMMRDACEGLNPPEIVVREIDKVEKVLQHAPPYEIPYDMVREYGELLKVWPRIVGAAKQYGRV
jgi:hypothetical protein